MPKTSPGFRVEACILAGGLSRRMGRDKAGIRLGSRTMLSAVRATAERSGLKARVIRRDLVPRSGPVGGIYTGLKTSHANGVLFLACDMPFITRDLLSRVLRKATGTGRLKPVFMRSSQGIGFPALLPTAAAPAVLAEIQARHLSLHSLCRILHGAKTRLPAQMAEQLRNINTPEELARAREVFSRCHRNRKQG